MRRTKLNYYTVKDATREDELKLYLALKEIDVIINALINETNSTLLVIIDGYELKTKLLNALGNYKNLSKYYNEGNLQKLFKSVLEFITEDITRGYKRYEFDSNPFAQTQLFRSLLDSDFYLQRISKILLEYAFKLVTGENVYITYLSARKMVLWSKTQIDHNNVLRLFTENVGYFCPFCGREFLNISELYLHAVVSHPNIKYCPLDNKYIDEHLLSDPEHYAYAYLTLFTQNEFLTKSLTREFLLSRLFASIRFNLLLKEIKAKNV